MTHLLRLITFLSLLFFTTLLRADVYSVVIGVTDYSAGNALRYADKDAYLFSLTLMSERVGAYDKDKSFFLLNEHATAHKIQAVSEYIFGEADSDDTVIFYYTGHGVHGGLYAYGNSEQAAFYPYANLRESIRTSRAGSVLIFIDACHSGSVFMTDENDLQAFIDYATSDKTARSSYNRKSVAIFMSSRVGETSYESHRLGHGVFTYYLCRALSGKADRNGDLFITMNELYRYLRNGTYEFTKALHNTAQCPLVFGDFALNAVIAHK